MGTVSISGGFGDEMPSFEGTMLVDAIWTVPRYWLLGACVTIAGHVDGGQAYFGFGDYDFELTGEEGAGRIEGTVKDTWWRLHFNFELNGFGSGYPRASFALGARMATGALAFVIGTEMKEVHG